MRRSSGFTVAELITVVSIVAVLSAIALPVARFGVRRQHEQDLRIRLQKISGAVDRYVDMRLRGLIKLPPVIGQDIYPKNLEELTKPIVLLDGKQIVLLRDRDLIDPMTGKNNWRILSSTDSADGASSNDDNVWDVQSASTALALDGKTHYNEW